MSLATSRVVIACLCAGALADVGCAGGPTSPSASTAASGMAATASGTLPSSASPRGGDLQVTKDCSNGGTEPYAGQAGDFCTITSSSVDVIEVGSKVIYAKAADFEHLALDTDVILDPPGPGNNIAFGHCQLNLATGLGLCTFSGGTGKFMWFSAAAHVSPPTPADPLNWHWDGTYSFSPRE
jgi:hypothetical protein